MGVAGGLVDDGVTPKETSTLRVGSAGRAASPMFNRIILIRHSARLNDGVDKTREIEDKPRSVIGETIKKMEKLLGASGANLGLYSGYSYNPLA